MTDRMRNLAVYDQARTSWSLRKFSDAVVSGASTKSWPSPFDADSEAPGDKLVVPVSRRDAVLVVLQIRGPRSYRLWLDGASIPVELTFDPASQMAAFDGPDVSRLTTPYQWLHFHVPRNGVRGNGPPAPVHRDDVGSGERLPYPPSVRVSDAVVHLLGECLIEAMRPGVFGDERLLEALLLSLRAHLAQAYGQTSLPVRGGLAPWQVRRAKQIMSENLEGAVAVEELAEACRLSTSHFARAFKATTGQPPHRWLLEYRIEHAKRLLVESDRPLTDIALSCGFADQSHFAKVFSRLVGFPPGVWRRAVKSTPAGENASAEDGGASIESGPEQVVPTGIEFRATGAKTGGMPLVA
jgi:AraC family transcriptional regulator